MRRKCAEGGKPWRGFDKIEGRAQGGAAAPSGAPVDVTIDEGMPLKGDAKAKVTIVECSDFDCPFCKRGADVVDQIAEKYGDKVAIYFRQFPLPMHPNAEIAHKAALAAHRQGKFWEMHDKLFENKAARTNAELSGFAQEIGLDVSKFETDLADPELGKIIERDKAACSKLGVNGTPTFYVNGVQVRGAQPLEAFSATIDAALAG
jgi:protein-disulfide isomerase